MISDIVIPGDIYLTIFSFLPSIKDIVYLTSLSHPHPGPTRNHGWKDRAIFVDNSNVSTIVKNYNFKYLKISRNLMFTSDIVFYLGKCHTLDLYRTNITDESIKELKNCHTLNLSYTKI